MFLRAILLLLILSFVSCGTSSEGVRHSGKYRSSIGGKILYKKGFANYKIVDAMSIKNSDTVFFKEIRFYDVYGATYLSRAMQNKLGAPDYEVLDDRVPLKVWENKQIKPGIVVTIATDGSESQEEIFTSATVFDNDGNNCLESNHPHKDFFIVFFSEAIWNLKD